MIISEIEFGYDSAIKDQYKISGFVGRLLKEVLSPLQPTINITLVDSASFAISEDGTQTGSSILKILNGTFDMRSYWQNQRTFGEFWKNELNLLEVSGICYAVADKTATWNEYYQENYFLQIFVLIVFVCLIVESLINHLWKQINVEFAMDFLRTSIGYATLWEPKTSFKRFIFLLIILPFIIITSYLQSELTSVITVKPTDEFNIEKVDDLMNRKYELFAPVDYIQYFLSTQFHNRIQPFKGHQECFDSLKTDFLKACVHDCYYLKISYAYQKMLEYFRISTCRATTPTPFQ